MQRGQNKQKCNSILHDDFFYFHHKIVIFIIYYLYSIIQGKPTKVEIILVITSSYSLRMDGSRHLVILKCIICTTERQLKRQHDGSCKANTFEKYNMKTSMTQRILVFVCYKHNWTMVKFIC